MTVPEDFFKTLCSAPWTHIHVANNGDISPCCNYQGSFAHVARDDLAAVWNGAEFADLRRRFLAGQLAEGCREKCGNTEYRNGYSHRQRMNHDFGKIAHAILSNPPGSPTHAPLPVSIDVRLSNLCNFRCRMCWHGNSLSWYEDAKALGETAGPQPQIGGFEDFDDLVQSLGPIVDGLQHVYFAGGEPLINPLHYRLLERLLEMGKNDVWLSYNTNLSNLEHGGYKALDLWSQFKRIDVEASIDGAGEVGELIRKGLTWSTFQDHVRILRQSCPHIRLKYGATVFILNVFRIPDLLQTIRHDFGATLNDWRIHPLSWPAYYSIRSLPSRTKAKVETLLSEYISGLPPAEKPASEEALPDRPPLARQMQSVIDYMNQADWSHQLDTFKERTRQLDKLRRERTLEILPELRELFREPFVGPGCGPGHGGRW